MDMNDEQIGERLQALRGTVISQAGLANAMKERGHEKWSQATVWSVEQGKRPLRLAEAATLAEILHADVGDLLQSPDEATIAFERLRSDLNEVLERQLDLQEAASGFVDAQSKLRGTLQEDSKILERGVDGATGQATRKARARALGLAAKVAEESVDFVVKRYVDSRSDPALAAKREELLAQWEERHATANTRSDDGVDQ